MPDSKNLGEWIRSRWGSQDVLAEKLKVSVATVSAYKTGRINVPPKIQDAIRKLGYVGPWPREEAKEAAAPAGVSEREIGKLEGRIEALERQVERLAEGFRHHMTKEPGEAHPQARA
jgi:hypothetical protein